MESDLDAMATAEGMDLVRACIGHEPGAWARFVDRYAPVIAMVARRTLRARRVQPSDEDIEDICENTLLAILKDDLKLLRAYDDQYALSTYLGVIARTHAGRYIRRKRHAVCDIDDVEVAGGEKSPEEAAHDRELGGAVREVLEELSDRDRKVLTLFYFSNLDYHAIAAELSVHVNSVGAALSRARGRLKERLEERGIS